MTTIDILKMRLIRTMEGHATQKGWSQKELAVMLGTNQPRVSNMFNYQIDKFSLDTLFKYVYDLDIKVEVQLGE